ncbi:hypothetical protein [Microvirga subterranea]|uniref:Uncharacterized protein n=1 Tax=Microvirga subterranea TaxID=186651 RepID=A0A370HBQ2_9HYPH|nr:hypothetical protein [Microvirga subterranea]RDI53653.1 hypothetical protein DES45_11376 [Microvirga subterranea]
MSSNGNRSQPNQTRVAGHQPQAAGRDGGRIETGVSHQEDREHNKHNHSGQSGHKPQHHTPDQEKR